MKPNRIAHLQLGRRESVRDGIVRVVNDLATSAKTASHQESTDLPGRVHATRLALKQTRALLRLLRPALGKPLADRIAAGAKAAGRNLAGVRDAKVSLDLLDRLTRNHRSPDSAAWAEVRAGFAKRSGALGGSEAVVRRNQARGQKALANAAGTLRRSRWKKTGWAAIEEGLASGYRRARRNFREVRKSGESATFHSWRTAAKSLYYQLGLLRQTSRRRLDRYLNHLDRFQATLGDANDLDVLASRLTQDVAAFGDQSRVKTLIGTLRRRQERLQRSSVAQGRKLFAERTSKFVAWLAKDWKSWRNR